MSESRALPVVTGLPEYLLPLAETYQRLPRRVGPWIDADEFLLEDRPALRLNDPSEPALRALHLQPWVQRLASVLDQRLSVALERPAVLHRRADGCGHAVLILFSAMVEIESSRVIRASLVPVEPLPTPWRESTLPPFADTLEEGEFSISPSPWQDLWLERYANALIGALVLQLGPQQDDLAWDYGVWLMCQMRRRHWTPPQRARTRSAVAHALQLDAEALLLAQRVRPVHNRHVFISDRLYNRALDSLDRWRDVQRAAPTLLALFSLVESELDPGLQPLQALRQWVLTPGDQYNDQPSLPPRFWRWLQGHGTRWLAELRGHLWEFSPETVRNVLVYVAAFEFQGPASLALLRAVARLYGNPNRPGRSPASWYQSQALRPLAVWWSRSDDAERRELSAWAPALANWLHDRVPPDAIAGWARRTWQSARFFMELDAIAERSEASPESEVALPWTEAFGPESLRHGKAELRVLRRPADIVQEGQAMCHCARQYLVDCQAGAAVMVSVREFRSTRVGAGVVRVATALLRPGSKGWYVDDIAGRLNSKAPTVAHRLAQQACAVLDACEVAQRHQAHWLAIQSAPREGA